MQRKWVTVPTLLVLTMAVFAFLFIVIQHWLIALAMVPYAVLWASLASVQPAYQETETPLSEASRTLPDETLSRSPFRQALPEQAPPVIASALQQYQQDAQEQKDLFLYATMVLDDFADMTERTTEATRLITKSMGQMSDITAQGQQATAQTQADMAEIHAQIEQIGQAIMRLTELTRKIDHIITSVSEIATQSNLLALNASIEAARAGIHGRGFAVVAEEVRALATQSTQSADQVRSILNDAQHAIRDSIKSTQSGLETVQHGIETAQTAHESIQALTRTVQEIRQSGAVVSQLANELNDGAVQTRMSLTRLQRINEQLVSALGTPESAV